MDKIKVGVIGCGDISRAYFNTMCKMYEILDVVACSSLHMDRARARAAEYEGVRAVPIAELLANPEIDIVVNLTVPKVHAEVAMQAVQAGKNVYNEKPIAITRPDGKALLASAKERGVRVGCAPDTFLSGSIQTCRKLIDDGVIGAPVGATAFMMCHGWESGHPNPEFFYEYGGGPMLDMGPYYITTLVAMLGPVRRVIGSTRITFPERTITSEKKSTTIHVEVPTHIAGVMDFVSGAVTTIVTSFDVWSHTCPYVEIYGSEGSIWISDPSDYCGTVRLRKAREDQWLEMPLVHQSDINFGTGVADMAYALQSGRNHRANGELAYHVLDIMLAFQDASDQSRHVELDSTCQRPVVLPPGLATGVLDE